MKNKTAWVAGITGFTVVGMLFMGYSAYAALGANTVSVCVTKSGEVRMIGTGFSGSICTKKESLVSWNITGPKGDKGDTGSIGATSTIPGPKGDKGDSGTALHLIDANNQDLGLLLDMSTNNNNFEYHSYMPSADVGLEFREVRGSISRLGSIPDDVYFAQDNCQGQAYILGKPMAKRQTTPTMFDGTIYRGNDVLGAVVDLSSSKHLNQSCTNFQPQNWGGTKSYQVEPLTSLVEPIAWPLHIQ